MKDKKTKNIQWKEAYREMEGEEGIGEGCNQRYGEKAGEVYEGEACRGRERKIWIERWVKEGKKIDGKRDVWRKGGTEIDG